MLKQKGFSLLEILIAFCIMALSLGILLNIFSGGINTAIIAEDYTIATQVAESVLAKVGSEIPLKNFQDSGTEREKYQWSVSIVPYVLNPEMADPKNAVAEMFKVNVTVEWGDEDDSDPRQYQLATLRLKAKGNGLQQDQ